MPFQNGSLVRGMKLIEFLEWARKSFDFPERSSSEYGMLALPPLQRNAAWNPAQVVGVWDSVLRGLPLGAFMLQRRPDDGEGRGAGVDARNKPLPKGWDLLDGQQRTRSLLLGFDGPNLDEGKKDQRCLWIDLDEEPGQSLFKLHLTSTSQPFGYDANGYKLTPRERDAARRRYEPEGTEIRTDTRRAYNHELFSGFIQAIPSLHLDGGRNTLMPPEEHQAAWPPLPAKVDLNKKPGAVMPLHVLVQAWKDSKDEGLTKYVHRDHRRFEALCKAMRCLDEAEIALIDASSAEGRSLPLLYDRIGAGGTPLSTEERLFSFYKSKQPEFHNIVCNIYEHSGRVMEPSKISASAIRIANAIAHQRRDQIPGRSPSPDEGNSALTDVIQFANALEQNGTAQNGVDLAASLNELVGFAGGAQGGPFAGAFASLFKALKYHENDNPLGLPSVLLGRLPPNLVQVLLFWLLHTEQEFDRSDNYLLRFVMFWLLCVRNEDKAANLGFRLIRETKNITLKTLFYSLKASESLSRPLISPDKMRSILETKPAQAKWKWVEDRIADSEPLVGELVRHWWHDGANILPWLQRHYLASAFAGYDSTADREDDKPYDVDHMIPQSDWKFDWGHRQKRLEPDPPFEEDYREKKFRWIRGELGDSIGNKWLVDYGINRAWSDIGFETKLQRIEHEDQGTSRLLLDVFPMDQRDIWITASPDGEALVWNKTRLESFQRAVETRAAWLYERLYEDVGFSAWQDTASMP